MMKRVILLSTLIFLALASPISAKDNSIKASIRSIIQKKIQLREQRLEQIRLRDREIIKEKRASNAAQIANLKKEIIRKFYNQMSQRISETIKRLETLISRIESRIAKIEAGGETVNAGIKSQVNDAKQLLTDSSALLSSSNNMLETVLSSNQPKEAFKILKENISEIKDNLVKVHGILVKVIGDIKGLRVGQDENKPSATPTP